MIEIISGTDRPGSNTLKISRWVAGLYKDNAAEVDVLDLATLDLNDAAGGAYSKNLRGTFLTAVERINRAAGLVMVVPEYNGSYPGILKLFIDYWSYPRSFEHRPVAFVGLGFKWGGLRPVEHLQQVFGYRNAYVCPNRVFLHNVPQVLTGDVVTEQTSVDLLKAQTAEFVRFVRALHAEGLSAPGRGGESKT